MLLKVHIGTTAERRYTGTDIKVLIMRRYSNRDFFRTKRCKGTFFDGKR
jgi:hypothetical protein